MMVGKTKRMNVADKRRMELMREMGCVPCMISGENDVQATVQHVTDCGRRLEDEHQNTYKSCPWHHLGEPPEDFHGSNDAATDMLGPSFKHNPKEFAEKYGTEEQLIQIQDALIRQEESERRRGGYLPPAKLGRLTVLLHREIVEGISPTEGGYRVEV